MVTLDTCYLQTRIINSSYRYLLQIALYICIAIKHCALSDVLLFECYYAGVSSSIFYQCLTSMRYVIKLSGNSQLIIIRILIAALVQRELNA